MLFLTNLILFLDSEFALFALFLVRLGILVEGFLEGDVAMFGSLDACDVLLVEADDVGSQDEDFPPKSQPMMGRSRSQGMPQPAFSWTSRK